MHCLWADLRVAKRANSMIQKGGDSWRHNVVNVTSHKQGHHGKHSGEILLCASSDKKTLCRYWCKLHRYYNTYNTYA